MPLSKDTNVMLQLFYCKDYSKYIYIYLSGECNCVIHPNRYKSGKGNIL